MTWWMIVLAVLGGYLLPTPLIMRMFYKREYSEWRTHIGQDYYLHKYERRMKITKELLPELAYRGAALRTAFWPLTVTKAAFDKVAIPNEESLMTKKEFQDRMDKEIAELEERLLSK